MMDASQTEAPTAKPRQIVVALTAGVAVVPGDNVSIDLAAAMFGTTRSSIENRISKGVWVEGRQYHRAPDGTIWIIVKGVNQWVATKPRRRA